MPIIKAIFNINHRVRVQLTDEGRRLHRENYDKFWSAIPKEVMRYPYHAPEEDKRGFSTWQMWELMKEFGPHIGLGRPPVFGADIELLDFTVPAPAALIGDTTKMCQLPPEGWLCTREAGHDGPCAAHPTTEQGMPTSVRS